ncbi:MAG: hypothetical protein KC422_23170 [Trueperaceae bacterium]|nr:hypothetical protein [Trueperaceae bacterium]
MTEERKILELLSSGQISVDEATELLDAVKQSPPSPPPPPKARGIAKMIRVQVDATEDDGSQRAKVDVNIPLSLAKFISKFLPREVKDSIEDQGIDLSDLFEGIDSENLPEGQLINIDNSEDNDASRTKIIIEVM